MKATELAEVYNKVQRGDPISDGELAGAIEDLKEHVDFLHELGERFHFAWWDLFNCREKLIRFREARKPSHLQWRDVREIV